MRHLRLQVLQFIITQNCMCINRKDAKKRQCHHRPCLFEGQKTIPANAYWHRSPVQGSDEYAHPGSVPYCSEAHSGDGFPPRYYRFRARYRIVPAMSAMERASTRVLQKGASLVLFISGGSDRSRAWARDFSPIDSRKSRPVPLPGRAAFVILSAVWNSSLCCVNTPQRRRGGMFPRPRSPPARAAPQPMSRKG